VTASFYRAFEDRHRGGRAAIKARLGAYLAFVEPLRQLHRPALALDLGCGRGEWLELMAENGFLARGVDLDQGMLASCLERGLSAEQGEAVATLRSYAAESVAVVSAFHLIEHLPFDQARALIGEALRVLQPGGLLIMETPNPENLVVGASTFYLDPSHVRPVPPDLLAFAVEYAGFQRHKIVRLNEAADLHADRKVSLLEVLAGASPDYSVVGQKAGAAQDLALFDPAFASADGIEFSELALRYEHQSEARAGATEDRAGKAEARLAQAEHRVGQSEARLAQAEARSAQAEHRAGQSEARLTQAEALLQAAQARVAVAESRMSQAEARMSQAEARMSQAEERANQADARLGQVLGSYTWRIPFRIEQGLRRAVAAARQGRAGAALRQRARTLLANGIVSVLHIPAVRSVSRALDRTPKLKAALKRLIRPAAPAAPPPRQDQLSPRATRIYRKLKQAIESRRR
jgi:SAM-dependent methyltransferase